MKIVTNAGRIRDYKPEEMLNGSRNLMIYSEVRITVGHNYIPVGYLVKSTKGGISVPRFAKLYDVAPFFIQQLPFINYPFIDKFVDSNGVFCEFNSKDSNVKYQIENVSNGRMREIALPEDSYKNIERELGKVYIYERNVPIKGNVYVENQLFFVTEYELYNLLQRDKYKGCACLEGTHPHSCIVLKANWINFSLDICRLTQSGVEKVNSNSCMEYWNMWNVFEGGRTQNTTLTDVKPIKPQIILYQGLQYIDNFIGGKFDKSDLLKYNNQLKNIASNIDKLG